MPGSEPVIVYHQQSSSRLLFGSSWTESLRNLGPRRLLIADASLAAWASETARGIGVDAVLLLPLGEAAKNLESVARVYQWLGEQKTTRDTALVAMGGGVATDLLGFAAATYLRGIRWAALSTTLLGQVDAAIGGKVGVNLPVGKNLVGAFHLPEIVVLDSRFLTTLPDHEWRTGLGEIIKSALIAGDPLYHQVGKLPMPGPSTLAEWQSVIREAATLKVSIVNQDPFESGPRMFLNFGHTIAHALENLWGYGVVSHGEAVSLGTLAALRLSEQVLGLDPAVRTGVEEWIGQWGLPLKIPQPIDFDALWEQLHRDKKARAQGLTWVLLKRPGSPQLVSGLGRGLVEEAFGSIV